MTPITIDPYDCGCTECITGEYVPLADATPRQISDMVAGRIGNNTGLEFTVSATGKFDERRRRPFSLADAETITVSTEVWDRYRSETRNMSWDIDPAVFGGAAS